MIYIITIILTQILQEQKISITIKLPLCTAITIILLAKLTTKTNHQAGI